MNIDDLELRPFVKRALEGMLQGKNSREMSKETGLSVRTCEHYIMLARKKLRSEGYEVKLVYKVEKINV